MGDPLPPRLRRTLRATPADAPSRHRILWVSHHRSANRSRDLQILQALQLTGHSVFDLDLSRHPACLVTPDDDATRVSSAPLRAVLDRFHPDLVLLGGAGWPLDEPSLAELDARGAVVAALTEWEPALSRADLLGPELPARATLLQVLRVRTVLAGAEEASHAAETERAELLESLSAAEDGLPLPEPLIDRLYRHLSAHHLYEHRMEGLLAALRRGDEAPGVRLQGTVRPLPPSTRPRPRVVLVSGFYGAGNRGDELLLDTLVKGLLDRLPNLLPVVAASKPIEVEREHGIQAFGRADLDTSEYYAAQASAMILGPGGHWHDYSIRQAGGAAGLNRGARVSPAHLGQLPSLVSAYGGTVHIEGMGVGPLEDPAARAAVNLTGRLARSVTVRDRASAELLHPLDRTWPADVVVVPDLVYSLDLPQPTARAGSESARPYLAVNLRPWTDSHSSRGRLHRAIIDHVARHGLDLVGVPLQSTDVPVLQALAAEAAQDGVEMRLLDADAPLTELLAALEGSTGLVAMRLHANLLMHRLRRSSLGLSYDPKVAAHFEQLGRPDRALALDMDPGIVAQQLERLHDQPRLDPEAERTVDDLERQARQHLDVIADQLSEQPSRRLDPGWVHHRPAASPPAPKPVPPALSPGSSAAPASAVQTPAADSAPAAAPEQERPRGTIRHQSRRILRGLKRRARRMVKGRRPKG